MSILEEKRTTTRTVSLYFIDPCDGSVNKVYGVDSASHSRGVVDVRMMYDRGSYSHIRLGMLNDIFVLRQCVKWVLCIGGMDVSAEHDGAKWVVHNAECHYEFNAVIDELAIEVCLGETAEMTLAIVDEVTFNMPQEEMQ